MILDENLKSTFSNLLNYQRDVTFKLLYRGSRDSFDKYQFRSKCTESRDSITLVKTTGGFIFGGYTAISWQDSFFHSSYSTGTYVNDLTAFIFSLVNKHNHPVLMKVKNGFDAISRNLDGCLTFGKGNEIFICDKSNACSKSSSNLGTSYQLADGYFSSGDSLAEGRNFQVQELEVFQLIFM